MSNAFTNDSGSAQLFQEGLIEQGFHYPLMPDLLFVGEFEATKWAANGTDKIMSIMRTERGTMDPDAEPLPFRTDPSKGTYKTRQYEVGIFEVANYIDTDKVANHLSSLPLWQMNMGALATSAGKTKMMMARAGLYNPALAGNTIITTTGTTDTVRVLKLNGFTRNWDSQGKLSTVSSTNPLPVHIYIGSSWTDANVIGFTPDPITMKRGVVYTSSEFLSGTLLLDNPVALGSGARVPIVADTASFRILAGGSVTGSVDDITNTDILTMQHIIEASTSAADVGLKPFDDGHFHFHTSAKGIQQLLQDPGFQRLYWAAQLKDSSNPYVSGTIPVILNTMIFQDSYVPQPGRPYPSMVGETLAAETVNAGQVPIHTSILIGKGNGQEPSLRQNWTCPLQEQMDLGGVPSMSKIGDWIEDGNAMRTIIDHMELILTAPTDVMSRVPKAAWSFTGGFEVKTDSLSDIPAAAIPGLTGSANYKAVIPVIHCG